MSKVFKCIYSVLFFVLLALPLALMPLWGSNEAIEKRALTKFPAYMKDGRLNLEFSDQFEAWFNDRIPFRSWLLSASNLLQGEWLQGETSNVIVGKDGWLFYATESADYMDTNHLSDDQIRAMAVTLSLIQENVESRGGHFVFVSVPNKSSVYGEYMPERYLAGEESNLDRIQAALPEYEVNFVDMKDILTAHKEEGVYHRRDSHWNYLGAVIGCDAILCSLGREHPSFANAPFTIEKTWRGDLDKLIYPAGGTLDDQYVFDIVHASFHFEALKGSPQGTKDPLAQLEIFMSDKEENDDLFTAVNEDLADGSMLYMVRDSFGRALLPYMIDSYETATFKRTDRPDLSAVANGSDLVYEIAERNLARIISTAPFMYAPVRDKLDISGYSDGGDLQIRAESQGYGLRICGAFPGDTPLGDGRVYLLLEQNGKTQVVEAFPILDQQLKQDGVICGFTAIVPKDAGFDADVSITVIVGNCQYH